MTLSAAVVATDLCHEFHGPATADGLPYDKVALVAAHKTLPLVTKVSAMNLAMGKTVMVMIVERMPERVESMFFLFGRSRGTGNV